MKQKSRVGRPLSGVLLDSRERIISNLLPEGAEPKRWKSLKAEASGKGISTATLAKYLKKLTNQGLVQRLVDTSTYPPEVAYKRVLIEYPVPVSAEVKKLAREETAGINEALEKILKEKDTLRRERGIEYLLKYLIPKFSDRVLLHILRVAEKKDVKAGEDYLRTVIEVETAPTVELLYSLIRRPGVLPIAKRLIIQHYIQWSLDTKRLYLLLKAQERMKIKSKGGEKHVKQKRKTIFRARHERQQLLR